MRRTEYRVVFAIAPAQIEDAQRRLDDLGRKGFHIISITPSHVGNYPSITWTLGRDVEPKTPYRHETTEPFPIGFE